jgi:hypothetical protein
MTPAFLAALLYACYPKEVGRTQLLILAVLALVAGCEKHDVGKPCPQLLAGEDPSTPGEDNQTITHEVIEQNLGFPCEELICVATAGREGYCTKKCRQDAGCPDGFECREVQPVGDFAGEKFCVWKVCESRGDCGNKEDFCCVPVTGADPTVEVTYCDFANEDGEC